MCGIVGIVSFDRVPDAHQVMGMAECIAHRGPDTNGLFTSDHAALAARRLALVDPGEIGDQPFASADGRFCLVFNGEVYNHADLRSELTARGHRFRSLTDTEVVLAAYREWGSACVGRFDGMWAFAVWDEAQKTLFCSRDRFGIKPFYYRLENAGLSFASELKAFAASDGGLSAQADVLADYLEFDLLDHRPETFFRNILQLPPAHNLMFDARGCRLEQYWRLKDGVSPPSDPVESIRSQLLESVAARLPPDLPAGFCLSGGLDSSAVVCAARRLRPDMDLPTFTAIFPDAAIDETPYSASVVQATGARAHPVRFTTRELVDSLPTIIHVQDEPLTSTSIAAQWFVMRAFKDAGLRVAMDGQGADEVFAGYPTLLGFHLADLLRSGRLGTLSAEFSAGRANNALGVGYLAAMTLRPFLSARQEHWIRARRARTDLLVHPDLRALAKVDPAALRASDGILRRRMKLAVSKLPVLTHSLDRNAMAHSVESRVPFLDHRLVETAFAIGPAAFVENGRMKAVLRKAVADLVPAAVLARRTKVSFATPESRFLREELGELAADIFQSRSFVDRGWANPRACRDRLQRHRRGELDAGAGLWRVLNAELWARCFIGRGADHSPPPGGSVRDIPTNRAAAAYGGAALLVSG